MSLRPTWYMACLGWGLTGCACEFPVIEGGSERTRANIRQAIHDFFAGVPDGSVCLSTVEVSPVFDQIVLDYQPGTRAFDVVARDPPDAVRDRTEWSNTTFFACLEADKQLGVPVPDSDLWAIEDLSLREHFEKQDVAFEKVAFGLTCAVGAVGTQLIGEVCIDDSAGTGAFGFVVDEVFTEPVIIDAAVNLQWQGVGTTTIRGAATVGFEVSPTTESSLRVALLDGTSIVHVDNITGQPVAIAPRAAVEGVGPEILGVDVISWASADAGTLVVIEASAANGAVARRLVYQDDSGMGRLDCARPKETVFVMDGMLWSAFAEGNNVRWGVWRPQ